MIMLASSPQDPFNRDLLPLIGALATESPLPYGDINWFGVWEEWRPVRCLVERKKLLDIVQCVLDTGRHMQQVQDARTAGFEFIWIFVEGIFRPGPESGLIEVRRGRDWVPMSQIATRKGSIPDLEYQRLDNYLNQLDLYLNVRHKMPSSARETAKMAVDLFYLFQKPPEEHTSLRQFYTPPDSYATFLSRPSLMRKIISQFEGVGWVKALAFEAEFPTTADMFQAIVDADIGALMKVAGVGKGIAEAVVKEAAQ